MTTKAMNEATLKFFLIWLTLIIIDRRERPLKIKGKDHSNGPSVSFIFSLMGFSIFSKYEFCKPITIKKIWYRHVPGKCCIGVVGIRPMAILTRGLQLCSSYKNEDWSEMDGAHRTVIFSTSIASFWIIYARWYDFVSARNFSCDVQVVEILTRG